MKNSDSLKQIVKDKYASIVMAPRQGSCGCCGDGEINHSIMSLNYDHKDGYVADADLKLGCGIPTDHAAINPGDHVLDLGSGAGNDVFVARFIVGESGAVTGLDFTDEMLARALKNNEKMGFSNVNFIKGDIENIPLPDNSYDVVISNCVLNLVPDKLKAFSEIKRVLKPGGHFCVSDIVLKGELPENMRDAVALYAGCVSGALQKDDYLLVVEEAGYKNVEVKSVSQITIDQYRASGVGIFSITVVGTK